MKWRGVSNRRYLSLLVPLALLLLLAVACGDDATPTTGPTATVQAQATPTTPAEPAPTPTESLSSDTGRLFVSTPTPVPGAEPTATTGPDAGDDFPVGSRRIEGGLVRISYGEPQYGGIMQVQALVDLAGVGGWDPHHSGSAGGPGSMVSPMVNSLLQFNPWTFDRFDIWGDLAESWSQEDPLGTIWEFKIKPHATWWDGTSVTAEDVAYSFQRMTGNTEGHPGAQGEAGLYVKPNYDRAEAVDATTVRIFLKNSWADFLGYMADDLIMMVPQHHYEPLDPQALEDPDLYKNIVNGRTTVMASGPFKPSNVIDKDQWSYRRNEIYWKKDPDGRNLPYLDGMDYFRVVDRTAAQAAWEAEQFDNTNWQTNGNMSPGQMVEMIENGGGKFVAYPAAISPRLLLVNTTKAPFDDPMVRKAVMLSIDRQAHNELVWGGLGVYGTICGPPSHPLCLGEEEVLKLPGFRQPKDQDWAEARRLLQEAGYGDGFTTSFITPNDLASQDEGPVLQDTLANVGIDVDHIVLDRAGHNEARINGNFDTILNSSGAGVVTPDQYLNTFFLFENIGNPFDWRYCGPCIGEPDVDLHGLIRQQSQALDPVERMAILRQIDDIVTLKDSGNIIMYIRSFARLFNADRVGGQMPTQSGYIETKAEQLWLLNP